MLAQVTAVNQARDNVAVVEVKVVVLPEDIRRNDRSEVATMLRLVHAVLDVHHTLRVRVAFVGEVRRAVVNHGFIDGKRRLVGKDAGRQARHELLDT